MRLLFLGFLLVPLLEMLLLFEVSDYAGGLWTLSLVVLTAVIGIQILKQQGFSTLLRARGRLAAGELPAQEIVEAMMLAAAGALLLTPGFLTDMVGFILLAGPLRRPLARRIVHAGVMTATVAGTGDSDSRSETHGTRPGTGNVYEGEYARQPDAPLQQPVSAPPRDED